MLRYLNTYHPAKRIAFVVSALILLSSLSLLVWAPQSYRSVVRNCFAPWGFLGPLLVTVVFLLGPLLCLAWCISEREIACAHRDWAGGLMDVRYHAGKCPRCGYRYFMYTKLLSKEEWSSGLMVTEYHTKYKYRIVGNVPLSALEEQRNHIWQDPPKWWWKK